MTSSKLLVLKDVHHVPNVRKNLVSASSLVQQGYKVVMESNRMVIKWSNFFIWKEYVCDDLFKLI